MASSERPHLGLVTPSERFSASRGGKAVTIRRSTALPLDSRQRLALARGDNHCASFSSLRPLASNYHSSHPPLNHLPQFGEVPGKIMVALDPH